MGATILCPYSKAHSPSTPFSREAHCGSLPLKQRVGQPTLVSYEGRARSPTCHTAPHITRDASRWRVSQTFPWFQAFFSTPSAKMLEYEGPWNVPSPDGCSDAWSPALKPSGLLLPPAASSASGNTSLPNRCSQWNGNALLTGFLRCSGTAWVRLAMLHSSTTRQASPALHSGPSRQPRMT